MYKYIEKVDIGVKATFSWNSSCWLRAKHFLFVIYFLLNHIYYSIIK